MYGLTGEPLPRLLGRSCGVGAVVPRGGTNGRSSSESLWLGGVSEPLLLLASFLFSSSISLSFQPGIPLVQLPAGKTFANAVCTSFAFRGHCSFLTSSLSDLQVAPVVEPLLPFVQLVLPGVQSALL